jgi:hypothetical protein
MYQELVEKSKKQREDLQKVVWFTVLLMASNKSELQNNIV